MKRVTEMKFKFTIQDYQTAAVDSVVTVFAGQPFQNKMSYRRDTGLTISDKNLFNWEVSDEDLYIGFSNAPVELDSHRKRKINQCIEKAPDLCYPFFISLRL